MGYQMQSGKWANTEALDLGPLQGPIVSADGYSRVVEVGDRSVARCVLTVGAHSTSDVLDVTVETSRDGVNDWYTAGVAFTQTTTAGVQRQIMLVDRFIRANYNITITGSPATIPAALAVELV